MNVQLCLFGLILLVGLEAAYEEEWAAHAEKYKLTFTGRMAGAEHEQRKNNFMKTHDMIEAHNKKMARGTGKPAPYRLGHNHFSHLSDDEKEMHMGLKMDPSFLNASFVRMISPSAENRQSLPTNVDWSTDSCMQPAKSQGYCGSCWIFSANAVLEFASCSKTGKPVSLSEEQIVDCVGYDGCKGGMPFNVWLYVATVGGQNSAVSYPYVRGSRNANVAACTYDPSKAVATVSASNPQAALPLYDVPARMAALANRQLLSVTLNCPDNFFNFLDGVFNGPCNSAGQNHAVNLVGYGTSAELKMDYWIVRNSWGKGWGTNGFMKIQRGVNMCGIEQYAWTTIASTGDVPLGVPYEFNWITSSDGLYKYSNCSYSGNSITTVSTGNCGLLCAQTKNCDLYSDYRGQCKMISKNDPQDIRIATSSTCGSVISRPTFSFTRGSNGLAMYAKKCSYTNVNRQNLPTQLSDEADCGAVCAVTSTCSYFVFVYGRCSMYAVANQSLPVVPSTQPSTYYSTCGYVTSQSPFVPNWQSGLNGKIMSAPNCGFIGTDPVDIANQSKNVQSLAEADCRSACASSSTCTNFRWSNGKCKLMSLVSPVAYYSVSGSCGYIVKP